MENDWLDADDAARSLHITKATLYKLIRGGEVPARKIHGQWRLSRRAIEELGLAPGVAVRLWIKTTALRWL